MSRQTRRSRGKSALVPADDAGGALMPLGYGESSAALSAVECAPPAVLSAPPTPWALLIALRRRWILAVSLAVLGAVLGATVGWLVFPVTWRARTVLHISSNRPFILFEKTEAGSEFANYQRSQVALMRSRLVLNAALRTPAVASLPIVQEQASPIEWLEKEIRVEFANGPELLNTDMFGSDPDTMIKVVNAVRNAYMKEIVNKEQNVRLRRLDQLQRLYVKFDELLRDKRTNLRALQEELGSGKSDALMIQRMFFYTKLENLQKEQLELQSQIRKQQVETQAAQAKFAQMKESDVPAAVLDEKLKQIPELNKLQKKVADAEAYVHNLKERLLHPESEPMFKEAKQALASAQESLASRRKELIPAVVKQMRDEALVPAAAELSADSEQLKKFQELEKMLDDQVGKKAKNLAQLGKGTVNLEHLEEDIAETLDLHKKVTAQKEALQVEIDAPSRVSILEEGYAIQTTTPTTRLVRTALLSLGLLALALFSVGFVEFCARRVNTFNDVVYGLGVPLVGTVPRLPADALPGLVAPAGANRWQQVLADSIGSVRTMLIHAARQKSLQLVMVSSAIKGEGKTLVSSHLATSMAMAGFKTLLVDADLRCPTVHTMFALPCSPGLSDVIQGKAEPEAVGHLVPVSGLTVMTAGQWHHSLVPLLAHQRLGEILDGLKKSFDFVIIDSAPVLATADTLLIAQHTDGVLLSVLCDVSRLPMVHLACERMAMLGVPTLGAVIGRVSLDSYGYGYASYGNQASTVSP